MPDWLTHPTLIQALALAVLTGLTLCVLRWLFQAWVLGSRRQALIGLELEAFQLEVESTRRRLAAEAALQRGRWEGFRALRVAQRKPENESGDVVSIVLEPHQDGELPSFRPGQHLVFSLAIPGQESSVRRCYSLSNGPGEGRYRVSVRKISASEKAPAGVASSFMHEEVREGDLLHASSPSGDFCIDLEEGPPLVLIAGGVGLTPFWSMFEGLAAAGLRRKVWLFYGARSSESLIAFPRLQELTSPERTLWLSLSRPNADDRVKIASDQEGAPLRYREGRLSVDWILDEALPPEVREQVHFYLCGPAVMLEEVLGDLSRREISDERVHEEFFGGKVRPQTTKWKAGDGGETYQVTLKRSERVLEWTPAHPDLLSLLDSNNIETVRPGCWSGNCRSCETSLLGGEVSSLDGENLQRGNTKILPCVCVPRADLVLDA